MPSNRAKTTKSHNSKEQILATARELGASLSLASLASKGVTRDVLRKHFGSLTLLREAIGVEKVTDDSAKQTLVTQYADVALVLGGRSPTLTELGARGIKRPRIQHHYGTLDALDREARRAFPDHFGDVLVTSIEAADPRKRTLIITSPVVGGIAHPGFCSALRTLADRKDADLIALPVADPASLASPNGQGRLDRRLIEDWGFSVVRGDLQVNPNLAILGIEISAKQIQPTTGLLRFGQRGQTLIVPSPKRFLQFVGTLGKTPHAVMTPGACTIPNYDTDRHRSKRTAYLAQQDHVLAAVIVELEGPKRFHFRQLTWSESDQNVVDLGQTHDGKDYPFAAVQLGDWHSGITHPANRAFALANPLGARDVFLHDSFDGRSISNHETPLEFLTQYGGDLRAELDQWVADLDELATVYDRVFVVRSNHDERLDRWLADLRHHRDRVNYWLGRQLEGRSHPLRSYYQIHSKGLGCRDVIFLGDSTSYKIGGVEMSQHGHRGANGSRRPSLASLELALGPCCVGHSHTPGIWREAWQAGTCTDLTADYTAGASSWFWSHIGIYPDGRRQMINILPED